MILAGIGLSLLFFCAGLLCDIYVGMNLRVK